MAGKVSMLWREMSRVLMTGHHRRFLSVVSMNFFFPLRSRYNMDCLSEAPTYMQVRAGGKAGTRPEAGRFLLYF